MKTEKYRQGTHSIPEIDRVAFATSMFLTLLETADEKTRNYLDYSPRDIKTLTTEPFILEPAILKSATMMFHHTPNDPWQNKIQYDPAKISAFTDLAYNQKKLVALVAHEADHMLHLGEQTKSKHAAAFGALSTAAAMTGYGVIVQDMSFHMAGAVSAIICAVAAGGYNKSVNYNAELKAYTQQSRVECYLGNYFSRSMPLINDEISKTKSKIRPMKEMFIDNYPSQHQRHMIDLKTNKESLKTHAPTLSNQHYHDLQIATQARLHRHNIHVCI